MFFHPSAISITPVSVRSVFFFNFIETNTSLQYVRDCLNTLRVGGGLQVGGHINNGETQKYIFTENKLSREGTSVSSSYSFETGKGKGYQKKEPRGGWEPPLVLPPTLHDSAASSPCDPSRPRILHMFWTGPLTDKPYLAILSFLYTQNLGLHNATIDRLSASVCRPQLWVWIDLDPTKVLPDTNAQHELDEQLKESPWSSAFLHSRFKTAVRFKLWNTTEQLDSTPDLKDQWRLHPILNSVGQDVKATAGQTKKISTVLSDLVRFVLLYRFGGIYIDGDTLFLRDWEELWGWRGAFAYRWSIHEMYNTAIIRMHKGSALGSFIFHTAMRNGWDFHPHTIARYMSDSYSTDLLYRLPGALFDPNWINWENEQRDRPPQPAFERRVWCYDSSFSCR